MLCWGFATPAELLHPSFCILGVKLSNEFPHFSYDGPDNSQSDGKNAGKILGNSV